MWRGSPADLARARACGNGPGWQMARWTTRRSRSGRSARAIARCSPGSSPSSGDRSGRHIGRRHRWASTARTPPRRAVRPGEGRARIHQEEARQCPRRARFRLRSGLHPYSERTATVRAASRSGAVATEHRGKWRRAGDPVVDERITASPRWSMGTTVVPLDRALR